MVWKSAFVSPRVGSEGGKRFKWANKTSSNSFFPTAAIMVAWGLIVTSNFILIQLGWGGNGLYDSIE